MLSCNQRVAKNRDVEEDIGTPSVLGEEEDCQGHQHMLSRSQRVDENRDVEEEIGTLTEPGEEQNCQRRHHLLSCNHRMDKKRDVEKARTCGPKAKLLAELNDEWKSMPTELRSQWEQKSAEAMEKYKRDLEHWRKHRGTLTDEPKWSSSAYFMWTASLRASGSIPF